MLSEKTKFEKSGAAATMKDSEGWRQGSSHADVSSDKLVANEVHFGAKAKSMEGMKGMESMDHK